MRSFHWSVPCTSGLLRALRYISRAAAYQQEGSTWCSAEQHKKADSNKLPAWAVALIAIGAGTGLAAVVLGIAFAVKQRHTSKFSRFKDGMGPMA
ncbi:hypothetical protein WJX72_003321 [[Myrmecia] bisecta]|uniref:Uncharacterized protein n=1 Tax=[Myrmecia] bisecta TaxID=41462 RepID=A0AAW1R601_9CHLO